MTTSDATTSEKGSFEVKQRLKWDASPVYPSSSTQTFPYSMLKVVVLSESSWAASVSTLVQSEATRSESDLFAHLARSVAESATEKPV